MLGMIGIHQERHLVRWKVPSTCRPSTTFGPVQPLGDLRTIIGQRGRVVSFLSRIRLDLPNVLDGLVQRRGHELMHRLRLIALHEIGRPAAASEKLLQFLMFDAGQHGRVTDLVAIEVQDRQHGPVGNRVEKLVGLPGGRQGARFRFTVADDAGDDQSGLSNAAPKAWLRE